MTVDQDWIRHIINGVREEIGRNVVFHTPTLGPCPLCVASGYYDATNDTTFYFTCPVCSGQYYLDTVEDTEILARIHWTNADAITATPGGKYYLGSASLTVEDKYLAIAEATQERGTVTVDGYEMTITKILPMGAPEINRHRIVLNNTGGRPE